MTMYHACFDTSGNTASFALFRDHELIIRQSRECRRGASALLPWIGEILASENLTTADIKRWSAGLGPGSFTGLRVSLAFIKASAGVANAQVRGLNSGYGFIPETMKDETLTILHDGRRQEVIANIFKLVEGTYRSTSQEILEIADLRNHSQRLGRLISPMPAIAFTDAQVSVEEASEFDASRFHNISWDIESDGTLEPIYVRPAVFVEPKKHRDISDLLK